MEHHNHVLDKIVLEAMKERRLLPEFPVAVLREVAALKERPLPEKVKDLRSLYFVSIDNDDSKDLDQLTYAEGNHIYVAIADVDAYVKHGSAIDNYAKNNTTSIYTPTKMFPMLPLRLSNDLTSLNENVDRAAIVIELEVDERGQSSLVDLGLALVRNHKQLTYHRVSEWLNGILPWPSEELKQQLILQDALAQKMLAYRTEQGALRFATTELRAILENGIAVGIKEREETRANRLIENFMIAANVGMTRYFINHNLFVLRRIVRVPKRWDRIVRLARELGTKLPSSPNVQALQEFLLREREKHPEQFHDLSLTIIKLIGRGEYVASEKIGHFDLALRDYAHTTAPNRRYPDLIMQRILKGHLEGRSKVISKAELAAIARRCTEKEGDVMKIERRMIKCAAAMVLLKQIGKRFAAIVTGASPKGTWVRLVDPPIEGKLTRNCKGVDVGDRLTVELLRVDVRQGHIDFGKCSSN